MLKPLFSANCEHVAWLQPQRFIFNLEMAYVAFIANGHAWSARSGLWIGPVVSSHLFDIEGRPVAWNPDETLRGMGKPLRPVNVVRAVSPVRPPRQVTPFRPFTAPAVAGGWSPLSFAEWLIANDPKPSDPPAAADEPSSSDTPVAETELDPARDEDSPTPILVTSFEELFALGIDMEVGAPEDASSEASTPTPTPDDEVK